jgi:hypothetical protein
LFRITSLSLPLWVFANLFVDISFLRVITILLGGLLFYRCYIRNNLFIRIRIFKKRYGFLYSFWLTILYCILVLVGKIRDDYGFLIGYIEYMGSVGIDTISENKVKSSLST